jgi:molybdopterin/thiamine biosynthesis adenylyltransferase
MQSLMTFNYDTAFSRNIGLVSREEQYRLKNTCVAVPGLGGVGGAHLHALARLGIGSFRLADLDTFDVVNFNRQFGATMETVGRSKTDVSAESILAINPDLQIRQFDDGITPENIDTFLSGVDIVIDGIEFFRMKTRRMLYAACRQRKIPIVNAGPIGYGAAVLVFMPDGPSFEEYFGLTDDMTNAEQLLALALGLAPRLKSDIDPASINIEGEKGPALVSACFLCAAAAATEVLKLVCKRGPCTAAPYGRYYDPYRGAVYALKRRPALTRTLSGRLLRWLSFRQVPAFKAMHLREIAERKNRSTPCVASAVP